MCCYVRRCGVVASSASSAPLHADECVPWPHPQYVVLRRDLWGELGWPLGSIIAQVGTCFPEQSMAVCLCSTAAA